MFLIILNILFKVVMKAYLIVMLFALVCLNVDQINASVYEESNSGGYVFLKYLKSKQVVQTEDNYQAPNSQKFECGFCPGFRCCKSGDVGFCCDYIAQEEQQQKNYWM
ncbi:hypothetical protein M3Y97_00938900 [Aphelenchoides bicaudatus]|nr:hypothetical protein M3Y97_00938900 [Aphelenchoides bicaudatus]